MCTPVTPSVGLHVARRLEEGAWDGRVARALAVAFGAVGGGTLARPLAWKDGLRVVTVGGATLGGSGKTPLAIACARALADEGARVVLVGHAYRARPGEARVVREDDAVRSVGDEAIACARALAGSARVVVAPTRQAALDHAARLADVVVIDGVLQTTPRRASLALLALDGESPWGAGEVVPRGDLRAPRAALERACDGGVELCDGDPPLGSRWNARVRSDGARVSGRFLTWRTLSPLRLGLFLALARPNRLLASLARRGIVPARTFRVPDHGRSRPFAARLSAGPPVDLWLASPKCALHLEAAGIPHAVLDHSLEPSASLRCALRAP
jgi:tetraacyldisaccharide 4'-kinase